MKQPRSRRAFSIDEDEFIIQSVQHAIIANRNINWTMVGKSMPSGNPRSKNAVWQRYYRFIIKDQNRPFTFVEDSLILQFAKDYKENWDDIYNRFKKTRPVQKLMERYQELKQLNFFNSQEPYKNLAQIEWCKSVAHEEASNQLEHPDDICNWYLTFETQ